MSFFKKQSSANNHAEKQPSRITNTAYDSYSPRSYSPRHPLLAASVVLKKSPKKDHLLNYQELNPFARAEANTPAIVAPAPEPAPAPAPAPDQRQPKEKEEDAGSDAEYEDAQSRPEDGDEVMIGDEKGILARMGTFNYIKCPSFTKGRDARANAARRKCTKVNGWKGGKVKVRKK